jgi:phenylalanyl-tRNA synthetase beta chain
VSLFEVGLVFTPEEGKHYGQAELPSGVARPTEEQLAQLNAGIPPQPRHVAVIIVGNAVAKQPGVAAIPSGIADALAAVSQIGLATGATIEVVQGRHKSLHPGRTAELRVGDRVVGYAGELLPQLALDSDLPRVVAVAELDLDAILESTDAEITAGVIGTLPAATQDLSLVVARSVPAGDVLAAVREGAGELLEDIRLVDDYRGKGVDDNTKSLTFALRFRGAARTLTAAEASEAKLAGSALATERFGAVLRE